MEQKKMSVIGKIWWIIYPALLFYGINLVVQMIVAIVVMVVGMANGSIAAGSMPDLSYESSLMQTILYTSTIVGGFATIILGLLFIKRDRKVHGLVRDKLQKSSALSWVAIVIICVCLLWISDGITLLTNDFSPAHQQTIDLLSAMGRWYYVVFAVIFAPLTEEIFCRGLIFKRIRSFMGFLPAAIISGAIFGIMHMNIVQGIYATLIGVIFAYIYEKKQSLFATIIAHLIVNGTNAALMFLPEQAELKFHEFFQGNNIYIVAIVSTVIGIAGILVLRKEFKNIPAWQVKTSA
jgi:membrane protease YdiL (CAAX protease family)